MYVLCYASMLQCWHLVWIMVRIDHPCLGVECHNTFLFLSELSSALITSFHLFQSERLLHSAIILGSGSVRKFSAMMIEKHGLTIVVLRSYTSLKLV
jgi:hypothetical protein